MKELGDHMRKRYGSFQAAVSTEIVPILGVTAVLGTAMLATVWSVSRADERQESGVTGVSVQQAANELGPEQLPRERFPGPLAVGVDAEEDSTSDECQRIAEFYDVPGHEQDPDEVIRHNGELIMEYAEFTCWVNTDGELFLTGVVHPDDIQE